MSQVSVFGQSSPLLTGKDLHPEPSPAPAAPVTSVSFPNALSRFVFTRTYPRWREEDGRRETYEEAVERYVSFLRAERDVPESVLKSIQEGILRMDVMPSMRAFWSAGDAAKRDNTMFYNCSFIPIDSLKSFSELLYILMMGTGVGFSVEHRFVNNLPVVAPDVKMPCEEIDYVVEDSTVGWMNAVYDCLVHNYNGRIVHFDYSKIRPAGARLKTKGGRASGPEPLRRLLDFIQETVLGAQGRKLSSVECNDIACMIGEIVMAGGVRRAALISFSDPDDLGMRHAKDWSRGSFPACRYMANNSAFWTEKPNREVFDAEWTALRNSGSGERGFFMFPKAKQAERRGDCRSNPCVTGETRVMTEGGLVRIEDLATMSGSEGYRVAVDLRFGQGPAALTDSSTGTYAFKTGTKDVFLLQTEEGHSLRLTADHRVMTTNGWKEAQDLQQGDLIHIANTEGMFGCRGDADAGMLAGWVTGDGTILVDQGNEPRLYFYESDHHLIEQMVDAAERLTGERPNVNTYEPNQRKYFQQAALREYMGQVLQDKGRVPEFVWQGTEECQRAYLSALFSADGSVGTNSDKGAHVRLHSSKLPLLQDLQRLLLNFGINSRIYEERRPAGFRDLPDGKGGYAPYKCEADHDLHISKANLVRFYERVGFIHQEKQAKLAAVVDSFTRGPYRETFTARFKALIPDGTEDVYDMTVPGPHSFMANGIVVHNCGEILLRYSESTDPWTGEGGGGQFCVAGDTPLITRQGLINIQDAVNQPVEVWNGERWSEVRPFQTGIGQKLYRVHFSDGSYLDTTAYHRFSVSNRNTRQTKSPWREMTVADLLEAGLDKRWATEPFEIHQEEGKCIEGGHAYTAGAAVGDGWIRKTSGGGQPNPRVYTGLWGEKDAVMPVAGVRGTPHVANASNLALKMTTVFCPDQDPEFISALKAAALTRPFRSR